MDTRYICDKCECNTMVRDAWVEWVGREWVIQAVYDESFCTNCGATHASRTIVLHSHLSQIYLVSITYPPTNTR